MMTFYPGNKTGGIPGLFGDPYYWWEAGAAFGSLIDYWYYTGDEGYVNVTTEAMLHQVGPDQNYMPPNQSKSLGNDDQGFWALSAISAAEKNFPNPPDGKPQWLALSQAVFNSQAARWDTLKCGGGLRWQIFTFNDGYVYKNTVSNGCFFQLGARLARYTGNKTYAEWAEKAYDWTEAIGLLSKDYKLFDGSDSNLNCSELNHIQWSYNAGLFMAGAAYMYNYTNGEARWRTRLSGLLNATDVFFINNTMAEVACESSDTCDVDQRSFKAYTSRFMALTVKMAPWTADFIMPKLRTSAKAAARHCSFGEDKNTCGMIWTQEGWDNKYGVGEQMCALETIQNNLVDSVAPPVTADNGGTSMGNPGAGTGGDRAVSAPQTSPTTQKDRIGAGFLTAFVIILMITGGYFMII
ncbi:glycoside hydrolase [Tuber brumale]|nr:glycoside hydrolase [Tuber brumale]